MKTLQLLLNINVPDDVAPEKIKLCASHDGTYHLYADDDNGDKIDISNDGYCYIQTALIKTNQP